jgi:nucleoside-diphosphate-sugar epimerase
MRLLVLGGTGFVGRAVVDEAVARGDDVTVLNRGRRPPVAGVTALVGDRTAADGLAALAGGAWDAVVDTWSGAPRAVEDAARAVRARHYTYVSSRSVYADGSPLPLTEEAPVVAAGGDDYAAVKRGGELGALTFGADVLLARAGLILGPHEDVGRLPWWLRRLARGGPTLAPGPRELPLQYIDARDLAAFLLTAADKRLTGAYNLVGPSGQTSMGELLDTANAVTGGHAELRWTDPEVILKAGIAPWTDLPIWLPPGDDHDFMHRGDVSKALAAGLRLRPIADTVADTWSWLRSLPGAPPLRADRPPVGLDPAAEAAVLNGRA